MVNYDAQWRKEKNISNILLLVKIITVFLIISAVWFVRSILKDETKAAETYLEQGALQTASNIRGRILNATNEMKVLSAKLSSYTDTFNENDISSFLKTHLNDYDFNRLIFAYPNGETIRYQRGGERLPSVSWTNDERFIAAMGGDAYFAVFKKDPTAASGYVNDFGIPVFNDKDQIAGVIGARICADTYIKVLGFSNYDKKGTSYIIDNNGDFIIKPLREKRMGGNFFDSKEVQIIGHDKEYVRDLIGTKDSGTFLFKMDNEKYMAAFAIIDKTERYVLTVVPLNVLMLHVDKLLVGLVLIVLVIGALLLAISFFSSRYFQENRKKMYEIAFVDTVTGKGNKNKFRLDAIDLLKEKSSKYILSSICVQKFDTMREIYGEERANKVLCDIFQIIEQNLSKESIIAHESDGVFHVLYKCETKDLFIKYFIEKIVDEIKIYNEKSMLLVSSEGMIITKLVLTFGAYEIQNNEEDIEEMEKKAEMARLSIENSAQSSYKFFEESMMAQVLFDKAIESEMYYALNDSQFKMYLQPKFNVKTGELTGAEALVRWIHPKKGTLMPTQFIPLFEKNGFIIELDRCIWAQAVEFLSKRKKEGKTIFPISVNVSRLHLNNDMFVEELVSLVKKYDVEPEFIELEITETACFEDEDRFTRVVKKLKEIGFTISMDDFGVGYSSLNLLRHLPIDVLKLDKEFVKDAAYDSRGQIVIKSIIEMANMLNITTVAEGVEFQEQADFLKDAECKMVQGFLYSRAVDTVTFENDFLN